MGAPPLIEIRCSACDRLGPPEAVFWRVVDRVKAPPVARPFCSACAVQRSRSPIRRLRAEATAEVRVEVMDLASPRMKE
jgi:hypothetical protein